MKRWISGCVFTAVLSVSTAVAAQNGSSEAPAPSPAPSEAPSEAPPVSQASDAVATTATAAAVVAPVPPPTPAPIVNAPLAPDFPEASHPTRWVALALAAGGIIAGGIFGVVALHDQSKYNQNPTQTTSDQMAFDGMLSDIFFGVGILSAAVATALFIEPLLHPHSGDSTTGGRAAARVHFTSRGLSVSF